LSRILSLNSSLHSDLECLERNIVNFITNQSIQISVLSIALTYKVTVIPPDTLPSLTDHIHSYRGILRSREDEKTQYQLGVTLSLVL
jgi:hypothetical protein